jgi:hypothetical protein
MIEVLDIAPREMKGTAATGKNYHFFVQKARVVSVDRDGIETADVVEVQAEPGEVLAPGDDYLLDPSSCYVGTYQDRNQRTRKRIQIGNSPRLVSFDQLARERGYVKAPAVKAA